MPVVLRNEPEQGHRLRAERGQDCQAGAGLRSISVRHCQALPLLGSKGQDRTCRIC